MSLAVASCQGGTCAVAAAVAVPGDLRAGCSYSPEHCFHSDSPIETSINPNQSLRLIAIPQPGVASSAAAAVTFADADDRCRFSPATEAAAGRRCC